MVRDFSDMVKLPNSYPGVTTHHREKRFSGWVISDMDVSPVSTATALLVRWKNGDGSALDQLLPLVYDELRRLARYYLQREV
jgi:hypothetical protein